jgi:hypothetical protein
MDANCAFVEPFWKEVMSFPSNGSVMSNFEAVFYFLPVVIYHQLWLELLTGKILEGQMKRGK